jgi:ATP-dependent helicase/nuclease subunit B
MYKGILIKDPSLLDSIDLSLNGDEAGKSLVFPLSFNKSEDKNGSRLGSNSSLITREQLQLLLDRNEERIVNAANKIFAGSVELNPARYSQKKTALQYSPYKDIFQFDAMLPDNNYHDIELPANKDFFKLLKEDGK